MNENVVGLAIAEIKMIKDALKFQLPFDMERESLAWQEHQASLKESGSVNSQQTVKQQPQKQQEQQQQIVETHVVASQASAATGEHSLNSDDHGDNNAPASTATTGHDQHPLM